MCKVNNSINLGVCKLYDDVVLPRKRVEDSGYDVCTYLGDKEYIKIEPGATIRVGTGLAFDIPIGYDLKVYSRSSTGSSGLVSMATVIDQGYTGECHLCIYNSSNKPVIIYNSNLVSLGGNKSLLGILEDIALIYSDKDAIFQFILEVKIDSSLLLIDRGELGIKESERGVGGFGSTNGSIKS